MPFELIPAIDLRGGRCVRLRQGDYSQETVYAADPVEMALQWVQQGARRLHLVDLDGARLGQPQHIEVIRAIISRVQVPCQVGGGLRDESNLAQMLDDVGADRIIVGTRALRDPSWLQKMTERFPGRICLGLDARDGNIATEGWLNTCHVRVSEFAQQICHLPLSAVIFTNIHNDGMLQGIDAATLKSLSELCDLGLPVIASGGLTDLMDVQRLAQLSKRYPTLQGAIVGRALYEGKLNFPAALQLLASQLSM